MFSKSIAFEITLNKDDDIAGKKAVSALLLN